MHLATAVTQPAPNKVVLPQPQNLFEELGEYPKACQRHKVPEVP